MLSGTVVGEGGSMNWGDTGDGVGLGLGGSWERGGKDGESGRIYDDPSSSFFYNFLHFMYPPLCEETGSQ